MALVLAFGIQRIADAVDDLTPGFNTSDPTNTADLGWLNIHSTITLDIDVANANNSSTHIESVYVQVSGGGANFPHPTTANKTVTSYRWDEKKGTTDPKNYTNGTLNIGADVVITVRSVGEVTVTVSWTSNSQTEYNITDSRLVRDKSLVRTFYVVKSKHDIGTSDTITLLNVTDGVGAGYNSLSDVEIYKGDTKHNPVTYTVTSGKLYIKEGTRTNKSIRNDSASLNTSSGANVWLSMESDTNDAENSHTVAASLATGFIATGTYIYGPRPKLTVTPNTALSSGNPGQKIGDSTAPGILATVTDKDDNRTDGGTVDGVPVKFEVADKSTTASWLIPRSGMTIVDDNNEEITPPPATAKILYVRTNSGTTGASVDVQLASTPGNGEITVSVVGKNVNVSETVTVGTPPTELSTISDTQRTGNSKIFDLVAQVKRGGNPLQGLEVTFQTTRGNLANTPTGETGITNPDGGSDVDDTTSTPSGLNAKDITDPNGYAQVRYNIGDHSGQQEIDAIIYGSDANKRQVVTFVVNGSSTPPTPPPPQTASLTLTATGTGTTRSVTVAARNAQGANVPGLFVTLSGTALPVGSQNVSAGTATTITLPSTPGSYTLTAAASGYTSATETFTITAPGNLGLALIGDQVNGSQTIQVTARTAAGTLETSSVLVSLSGAGISRTVTVTGSQNIPIVLPTASGTLTASATGYN